MTIFKQQVVTFFLLLLKQRLWVLIRTASLSAHNQCLRTTAKKKQKKTLLLQVLP